MRDLITVIIPVYNVERYLERCMQSVLKQTYSNLEIILVDDKSSDRSNELCLTYLDDNRVTLIHGNNEGLSGARNVGLDNAHGKYVVFIDSDDFVETSMINNLYKSLIEAGADTAIGGYRRKKGNSVVVYDNIFSGMIFQDFESINNLILKKMLGQDGNDHIEMSVWKVIFSMKIINENQLRFPDKKYLCEDIIFDFGYYPHAKKVVMSDDTGYCYCLNGESLSQGYQKNKFERLIYQAKEMRNLSSKCGFDDEAEVRIDNFLIGNLIHHLKTMAACKKTVGYKNYVDECYRICNSENIKDIRWSKVEKSFHGRDLIPYKLLKNKQSGLLSLYLLALVIIRKMVRR